MRDFDVERAKRHSEREQEFGDRPFKFGGETFYVRPNVGYVAIHRIAALSDESGTGETFDAVESAVLSMIDPRDDAHARFRKVTKDLNDPITFEDLTELQNWLIQEQAGRPPTQPQSSVSSPETVGTSSTDASSTEQEGASTT